MIADTEGENADFADGPEYGTYTLDSLRAAISSPAAGLQQTSKIGIIGYSGGAIGAEWAAQMAPSYAPDINRLLVGSAFGGVLVDPDAQSLLRQRKQRVGRNHPDGAHRRRPLVPRQFHPVPDSLRRAAVQQVADRLDHQRARPSIRGSTINQLLLPQYQPAESIPIFVQIVNQLIMGANGTPTAPLLIGQGGGANEDLTVGNQPGIGIGDGVMVTGDVRSLASEYCQRGVKVQYNEYDGSDHIASALLWVAQALPWLNNRFSGQSAPQDCASIPAGNSLASVVLGVSPITP